jgi:hypothetical protein
VSYYEPKEPPILFLLWLWLLLSVTFLLLSLKGG